MIVYIAGKITGEPKYKEKFLKAEEYFAKDDYIVLNPAILPEGMSSETYMNICFPMIREADLVAFLPNWRESRGAKLEFTHCQYIGKTCCFLEYLTDFMEGWN